MNKNINITQVKLVETREAWANWQINNGEKQS